MPSCEITIINKLGLHARAAAKFVGVAGRFPCQIKVGRAPESLVDGKSIMAVMMLAAGKGTPIHLHTDGEQDDDALNALIELINNFFDEGE
ncbi:HPr family phosphocarrier protein [Pseudomonas sp.]|jgi:phosphocarrier protein|uniref:HPr family phosphocarrier protein n=1 Tax=Pseudomonas sp. TaxID=306 RepID=UPI0027317D01|nr:HPr family phosphocarrier protein [Pseudomonas sp.]MDP2244505.1 HPr family phosphocarrier protein [Pseudomonas sp.]